METNTYSLLLALDQVYQQAAKSNMQWAVLSASEPAIQTIAEVFPITPTQAVLLAIILGEGNTDRVPTKHLAEYLGMTPLQLMPYLENLQELKQKNILVSKSNRLELNDSYQLNPNLLHYLVRNEAIPKELFEREIESTTIFTFLREFQELKDEKESNLLKTNLFRFHFKILVRNYTQFPFIAFMDKRVPLLESLLLTETLQASFQPSANDYPVNLSEALEEVTDRYTERMELLQACINGTMVLQLLQLIEKNQETFANRVRIKLSDKCLNMLEKMEGIPMIQKKKSSKYLQYPEAIPKIKLIYNPKEANSIGSIDQALQVKTFAKIQQQLQSKGLPVGLNCLLYGPPGTGKTATVYQLARKHQRAVFKVEIAETKSMWYGESQKLVKKIFTDYADAMKYEKRCPILLFNEADAIIHQRNSAAKHSTSETENAIQNILLEELENFKGILFATTNLVERMDPAFERRFLYKIALEAPTPENAAKIWQGKLPHLQPKECKQLVANFAFSPGEIDNISRKVLLEEVLHGTKPSLSQIIAFCEAERWHRSERNNKIGF